VTHDEFQDCIQELRNYYGESAYPPAMAQVLWNILHTLSAGQMAQVVERLVEEHPRTPSVASVKKSAIPYLRLVAEHTAQEKIRELEEAGSSCELCGHTGYVIALLRTDPRCEFAFRCTACPGAKIRRISHSVRDWAPEMRMTYTLVSLRKDSFETGAKLQRAAFEAHLPKRTDVNMAFAALSELSLSQLKEKLQMEEPF
jgi:hypothetical protein